MKILLLNQTFYPDRVSTAQYVLDIALFLRDQGAQVSVVTDRRGYEVRETKFAARETHEGIEIHRVRSTGFGKSSRWRRLCDSATFDLTAVWKMLCLPRHDVIICFTSPPLVGVLGTIYRVLKRARAVQWLMDVNPDAAMEVGYLRRGSLAARFLTGVFHLTLKRSDYVVVLDRWMKERVLSHGAREANVLVISPWTLSSPDANPEAILKSNNPFAKQHGLTDQFIVFYSGNFSIAHPLDTVLASAVRLRDDPSIKFVFAGGGIRAGDIDEAVEKHRLKNVLRLPWQPREMLRFSLGCADLHVVVMGRGMSGLAHTSKIYGILSDGKPYVFVGPKQSHLGDLLEQCPNGFHVEHGDVDGFLSVIEQARRLTRAELARMGQANRQHVREYCTIENRLQPLRNLIS